MARSFEPVVLTANDLESGEAVWWTGAGWSADFADARVARTELQAAALEGLCAAPLVQSMVVGPYLAEVVPAEGAWRPASRREAIRAGREPTFLYGAAARPGVARAA